MPIYIIKEDITKMKCDAIVNAANATLLGGGGVDGAIHKAAGPGLKLECMKLGGCKVGEAKITQGHKLNCKHIIHTVGPKWKGGKAGEKELLENCYKNSLRLVGENSCKTVAFPLISCGAYGYPKAEAFRVALDTMIRFLNTHNNQCIYIVCYDEETYQMCKGISFDYGGSEQQGIKMVVIEVTGILDADCDPVAMVDSPSIFPVANEEISVGSLIENRYKVLKLIGQGGMSKVYLVENIHSLNKYALKVINLINCRNISSAMEGITNELQYLTKMSHFMILRIFDVFSENLEDTTYLGTIGYAVPEQFGRMSQTDARADIYGLGATLYHLLTGKNPMNPPYQILPICQINPAFPKKLEKILLKCVECDQNRRYQNCLEVLDALTEVNSSWLKRFFNKR